MKYGNYWDESQVRVGRANGNDTIPFAILKDIHSFPAFIAITSNNINNDIDYIFVEIIPGSGVKERFLNLSTGQYEDGISAKVNIYRGKTYAFENMRRIGEDNWPLNWFNLTEIPKTLDDPYDAYIRAMGVLGG